MPQRGGRPVLSRPRALPQHGYHDRDKAWEYRHDPNIFSPCCSNGYRRNNGNTLVMFGSNIADPFCRPFFMVEVDPAGNVILELVHRSATKDSQYRVYPSGPVMGRCTP